MNIVEINSVNRGSTGSIMRAISDFAKRRGHNVLMCYPDQRDNRVVYNDSDYLIGNRFSRNIGVYLCSKFKFIKFAHTFATLCLLRKLKSFKPDVIHLHNLHPLYLNLSLFFNYINKYDIKVVITLHDCWLYTGHCPYYTDLCCLKWMNKCYECPVYTEYPKSNWDDSSYMFNYKKKLLLSLKNLTLVPVSNWLGNEVKKSFLHNCRIQIISNGIDLSIFKPTFDMSVLAKYGIKDEFLIMGCATEWGYRKGLEDYLQLSTMLHSDEKIILVGISESALIDKPSNIILINRTEDVNELACLYSRANVLLSLSKEETFGLTIIEAMACGTPAIVYNNTAQPELINNNNGFVVSNGDLKSVRDRIDEIKLMDEKEISGRCVAFAKQYGKDVIYKKYMELLENSIN